MSESLLYALQRVTALILAPLVLVHLAVILHAVEGGLSAEEILSRTRGSLGWMLFYGLFVLAAAIHAPIGLRNLLLDWAPWTWSTRGAIRLEIALAGFGLLLLGLGLRAVWAVIAGGSP